MIEQGIKTKTKTKLLCLLIALAVLVLSSCAGKTVYDWGRMDALMEEIGKENNSYYTDGSLAMIGKKIDIYYNKDDDAEIFVRLNKRCRSDSDDYYSLMFEKHFFNLVDGYIVSVNYTCSFHYSDVVVYNTEVAGVDYYKGAEESTENFYHHSFYQVENIRIEDGQFISCDFTERPLISDKEADGDFSLPGEDSQYFNELMKFGFARTTEFFLEHNLNLPY